jgi:hypothetical protein
VFQGLLSIISKDYFVAFTFQRELQHVLNRRFVFNNQYALTRFFPLSVATWAFTFASETKIFIFYSIKL